MPYQPMNPYGPVSQGDELPVRQSTMVQANAGLGFGNPSSYPLPPFGSTDPSGIGSYAYRSGSLGVGRALGSFFTGSPLLRSAQILRGKSLTGLGDDAATPAASTTPANTTIAPAVQTVSGLLVAAVAVGLVVTGASGYFVGKAVAPSRDKEGKYAWWGVAAALLGGPLGLGIEAAIALEHK